ncbi:CBS domain-containing protein [Mameliella alba]|nr:CBS domain-containing protein [Antarctobacter heliothermus]MBY6142542.1 CBS domain-containing protein [Mameliella alba]MCA0953733.1 CBS domain-containing protein [Mameliella alba]
MPTTTIRKILGNRALHAVAPDMPLREVAQRMADAGVGAVVVLHDGALAGVLSERDIVFRAVAKGLSLDDTPAQTIMTPDPVTVDIDADLAQTLKSHLGTAFRHMPVVDNGKPVGLLSYRDVPAEYVMLYERFVEMTGARADQAG